MCVRALNWPVLTHLLLTNPRDHCANRLMLRLRLALGQGLPRQRQEDHPRIPARSRQRRQDTHTNTRIRRLHSFAPVPAPMRACVCVWVWVSFILQPPRHMCPQHACMRTPCLPPPSNPVQASDLLRQLRAATSGWFSSVRGGLQEPYAYEKAQVALSRYATTHCFLSIPLPMCNRYRLGVIGWLCVTGMCV
jgi:hypothetical protein